jgi:small-conductance mechanosensitive channel
MKHFMDEMIWGNPVRDWLIAIGIVTGCLLAARLVQSIVIGRLRKAALATTSSFDDLLVSLLRQFILPFAVILSIYIGLNALEFSSRTHRVIHAAVLVITVYYIIRAVITIATYLFGQFVSRESDKESKAKKVKGIMLILKIVLWLLGFLFIVDNLGYNITTIITGLGIGGIAIALAAQAVLGDLFSYLAIFFDKPFEEGDFIIIGDKMGSVEFIGIKTTRLRAIGGEQLIVSNTDLTNSRVQNYKRMEQRRVVASIGVTYDTAVDKLKKIPAIVKTAIETEEQTKFDRAHFTGFGDSALNFEIVYYILTSDYIVYMDCQQRINWLIMEAFANDGIDFAYPTRRLIVESPIEKQENAFRIVEKRAL